VIKKVEGRGKFRGREMTLASKNRE
jgi:hypothetical protein